MRFFISIAIFILLCTGSSLYGQTGGEPVDKGNERDTTESILQQLNRVVVSQQEAVRSQSGLIVFFLMAR